MSNVLRPRILFGELEGVVRRVLLHLGKRELRTPEGIEVWPVARFLEGLAAGELWP